MFIIKTNIYVNKETIMSKKQKTKLINEKAFKDAVEAILTKLKATNSDDSNVTITAIPLSVDSLLDSETVSRLDNVLRQAHKKLTQGVETEESDDTEETCCSEGCDCSCDREAMIDSFSRNVNKIKVDFSDAEEDDEEEEDYVNTIRAFTGVTIPITVALDISLVRRLIKKANKEAVYLDPCELLSNEYSLEVCTITDSFIISLKSLETYDTIRIQLSLDGSTRVSDSSLEGVFYVEGERKTVDALYAWAARNLMMSDLVRLDNDDD